MAKRAYMLVTDLHIGLKKANRIDYFKEVLKSLSDIIAIAEHYKNEDKCQTNLILLGDVFDISITNASDAMQASEVFRFFCSNFDNVWAVVGNHELTYAKDNPFWFAVSDITDPDLQAIKRYIQPRGLTNTVSIVDKIVDGELVFYFNHFNTPTKRPVDGAVRIGLFHQNIGSNSICKMYGQFDDVEKTPVIQSYNYCFFGHMHLAKGKYYINPEHTCLCQWLGTIGRTKIDEVIDTDLQVDIPTVIVEDGAFIGIDDNFIKLVPSSKCIDKNKLAVETKTKQAIEMHRQSAVASFKGETLFKTLETAFKGTELEFFLGFLNKDFNSVVYEYKKTLKAQGGNIDAE